MARGERNAGWSGFFLTFTVFAAILLLLAREGQGEAVSAGARQVLVIYEGLTCWAVPALFMSWGMAALEEGKPSLTGALAGLVLPAFCLLLFWGAAYALAAHLLGGGAVSWSGILGALRSAALGDVYFHLRVLYPLLGLYLVHPVLRRFTAAASRGEVLYFSSCASSLPACCRPGRPSTRRGWWVPCWRGSRSIWCWGMRAIMWRGGICATIPSGGCRSSCSTCWASWGWS